MPWAAKETADFWRSQILPDCSYEADTLEQVYHASKRAHRQIKQEAADVGTAVHRKLERYFREEIASTSDPINAWDAQFRDYVDPLASLEDERVTNSYDAALAWLASKNLETIAVERRVYSRKHGFAGTLDKLARIDGQLALIDWKTSKDIWPEYRLQTSAYVAAYEEETGERINKRVLVRLGKEDGAFEPHEFDRAQQRRDFHAFLGALSLYRWQRYVADEAKAIGAHV